MSDSIPAIPPAEWRRRSSAALGWVERSIAAAENGGSAHSFSPLWGWARAYPETTGYLIETMLQYARLGIAGDWRRHAFQCGDWLCSIQLPNGAFSAGLAGQTRPSVFNTAQILFGLVKLDAEILAEENIFPFKSISPYRLALGNALDWLMEMLEPDGVWRQAAYVPGFVPSYYTRAVWGAAIAALHLNQRQYLDRLRGALAHYVQRIQPDGTVSDWGFRPGKRAFTHTIAYTLEGFLECACLFEDRAICEQMAYSGTALLGRRMQDGRTAGRYGMRWAPDLHFQCPVGTAQLSVFFHRLWQVYGLEQFRRASFDLLVETMAHQKLSADPNRNGALPGSAPFWGPYLRFRYPNWGVKFLLDALAIWRPELEQARI